MIYRVSIDDDTEGNLGFSYFGSKDDAELRVRLAEKDGRKATIEKRRTPKDRFEWLWLLNQWASHANNG